MTNSSQHIAKEIEEKTQEVIELVANTKRQQNVDRKGDPQKESEFKRLTMLSVSAFKLASSWAVKRLSI